jgi:threonine dehydrogenase-like Zn-dependent dehydrogenase
MEAAVVLRRRDGHDRSRERMTTISPKAAAPRAVRAGMRAATLEAPGRVRIDTVPVPEPGAGQVRVRVEWCGVGGSDVPVWEGREWFRYPLEPGRPGHEGCGTVDAVGESVEGLEVGERVAFLSYRALAEYDLVDASAGCAVNVLRRNGIEAGQTVAVVGIGFLGAVLVQMAARAGVRVVAVSRRRYALDVARAMGAAETLVMDDPGAVVDAVGGLTAGRLCEVVIEASGAQRPLDLAAQLTRVRGRLVIAGYHMDGPRQVDMQTWNWRGLDVINAHERDPAVYVDGIARAAALVAEGGLDPSPLYTHTFPLERLDEALEAARTRPDGFMKALVTA